VESQKAWRSVWSVVVCELETWNVAWPAEAPSSVVEWTWDAEQVAADEGAEGPDGLGLNEEDAREEEA